MSKLLALGLMLIVLSSLVSAAMLFKARSDLTSFAYNTVSTFKKVLGGAREFAGNMRAFTYQVAAAVAVFNETAAEQLRKTADEACDTIYAETYETEEQLDQSYSKIESIAGEYAATALLSLTLSLAGVALAAVGHTRKRGSS